MMRRIPLCLSVLPIIAGCVVQEPVMNRAILTRATEPVYQFRSDGAVTATACLRRGTGLGVIPPGCVMDQAFAVQAAVPSHLVHPVQPGLPYAVPAATAAYDYIYGAGAAATPGGRATQGQPGVEVVIGDAAPVDAAAPAADLGATPATPPEAQP